jgi:hypothetical protein
MGSTVGLGYELCAQAIKSLEASGLVERSPYMPPGAKNKEYCVHLPGVPSNRAAEYAAGQRKEAIAAAEKQTALDLGEVDTKAPLPRSGPDKAPRVIANPGHPTRKGETERVILGYIRNHPGATSPEIMAATGWTSGKVGGPLWRLEHERGLIYSAGKSGRTRMFVAYESTEEEDAPEPQAKRSRSVSLWRAGWFVCTRCGAYVNPTASEHRCNP